MRSARGKRETRLRVPTSKWSIGEADVLPQLLPQVSPVQTKMVPRWVIFWCEQVKPVGPSQKKRGEKKKEGGGRRRGREHPLSTSFLTREHAIPLLSLGGAISSFRPCERRRPLLDSNSSTLSHLSLGSAPSLLSSCEGRCPPPIPGGALSTLHLQ